MFLLKLNPIEPPWYGPVCPVVWEGWHREVSPYPDLCPEADPAPGAQLDEKRPFRELLQARLQVTEVDRSGKTAQVSSPIELRKRSTAL